MSIELTSVFFFDNMRAFALDLIFIFINDPYKTNLKILFQNESLFILLDFNVLAD
jgi:hypothetical protein